MSQCTPSTTKIKIKFIFKKRNLAKLRRKLMEGMELYWIIRIKCVKEDFR
jgi:hypothetical protein